ncbi:MAG: hypothetical protein IID33_11940, partial [Planctomycetes bacterium]|nr:hypothetical protein [Planctomycetota bacterium]
MRHSCIWLTAIVTAIVFVAPPAGAQEKAKKADAAELKIKLPKPAFKGTPKHVPPGTNLEKPRKGPRKPFMVHNGTK